MQHNEMELEGNDQNDQNEGNESVKDIKSEEMIIEEAN
jgi:hypothetical protein